MSLEISIKEFQDYIRVEVSGARTSGKEKEDAVNLWRRVVDACSESGINRVLVVSSVTGRIPTLEAYEVAGHPEEFGWSRDYKLALVDLDEESRRDNIFAENVAVNRGFQVKVFDNEQEAEIWLLVS